jgi:hypothetical protein
MLKQMVLVAGLIVSGTTMAGNTAGWTSIGASANTAIFLNTDRVKVIDSKSRTISFWDKTEALADGDAKKKGDYTVSKNLARCSDQMFMAVDITAYHKNGLAKKMTTVFKDAEWIDPLPNSVFAEEVKIICHAKYPK